MGIVIEEMDATIMPAPERAHAGSPNEEQKPKTSAAEPLGSSLQQLMRRHLRVKAD
jgi:hypothetical protein